MKASVAPGSLAVLLLTASVFAAGQDKPANPYASACGANPANFSVKHAGPFSSEPAPAGKALVYVIESMPPDVLFLTTKVNIGLDGSWLGATDLQTYMSFIVDPGVHHLCAVYQGHLHALDESDQTLLLHLDAKPGKTYYLRYQAFFLKEEQGFAFFGKVDEDEGQYLLLRSEQAISKLKK